LLVQSVQPSILTMITIILDDYLKANPGVKDLPQPGIEPQPPTPLSDAITLRPQRPHTVVNLFTPSTITKKNPMILFCLHFWIK